MRSNVTVGPPIDMVAYRAGELRITRRRRFHAQDPDLLDVHSRWENALRKAVQELPEIRFDEAEK
jgi:putative proteasome-type protease